VAFSTSQQQSIDDWLSRYKAAGINTPHVNDIKAGLGEQVYFALVERGDLVPLNSEVVYPREQYLDYKQQTITFLRAKGSASAGQIRDLFNTSRKYAIAWLEHLDERRVTRRVGDNRELFAGKN
jgi:selenocysteine-specific elongation factor